MVMVWLGALLKYCPHLLLSQEPPERCTLVACCQKVGAAKVMLMGIGGMGLSDFNRVSTHGPLSIASTNGQDPMLLHVPCTCVFLSPCLVSAKIYGIEGRDLDDV